MFFISGTDNEYVPTVVAATLTVEIFKKSLEVQQGCEHIYRDHTSKVVKLFVKPDAKVRLPFVGEVVPLCRARAATISVGQAFKSRSFYHVAKSFWRNQWYDYFVVPGENDMDLNGGSFVPAWAINKIPVKITAEDEKKKAHTMDVEDSVFEITIGTTSVDYTMRTMVFRTNHPEVKELIVDREFVRLTRKPFPEEAPPSPSEQREPLENQAEAEAATKRRRIMARHILG